MADIDSGDAQRFKLFGTTIAVQVKEEMVKGDDQGTAQQRTGRIIPCPRCKSMETKFCYFNNYNINQPRHFCRSCQRYWTAGGTLRNIPVGAGRRKTKPSTHRPIRLSDNFIFDASTVDEFLHGGMVEQRCMMASGSGFQQIFPAKRLSNSQARQIF